MYQSSRRRCGALPETNFQRAALANPGPHRFNPYSTFRSRHTSADKGHSRPRCPPSQPSPVDPDWRRTFSNCSLPGSSVICAFPSVTPSAYLSRRTPEYGLFGTFGESALRLLSTALRRRSHDETQQQHHDSRDPHFGYTLSLARWRLGWDLLDYPVCS